VSAIDTGGDIAMKPLDAEIKAAGTPSMAASLRVTEQARKQLAKGAVDAALRSLTQAVSIDPGDPFAYYFLGRAHFERRNYQQALTFFHRAQLGFSANPVWMGEVLSYEGQCDEALGDQLKAAKAYQRAIAVAPANFRARIGYGRLSAMLAPTPNADIPPSPSDAAPPAPSTPIDAPPPAEPSAPPAQ
jgi:tetratricopeptide (TPR) repeat protein